MRRCTIPSLLLVMALCVAPASAQQLSLTIHNGLVNLDAQGATIRQILDQWSRVGGTKIVNGERIAGGPVTLKLVNTPERQALEVVLRSAAGYMAIPRAANGVPGESMFDRIMVLPTSSAPQNAKGAPPPSAPTNPFLRGGRQAQGDEDDAPAVAEAEPDPQQPPVFSFPNQGQPENAAANPFMQQGGGQNQAAPFGQPAQGSPFGAPAQGSPFGAPAQTSPFGAPAQNSPFAPTPVQQPQAMPFGQPTQTPFGQVQPQSGQQQTPVVNPFAAALGAAQQQQQQQQQQFPNVAPPAPGTFQIIGSPTPGVVQQPPQPTQPTNPFQRPPGQK